MSLTKISKIYEKFLKKNYLLVQCIQTSLLMSNGDIIAQELIEKRGWKNYKIRRTVEFAFLGGCLVAPAVATWYKMLEKAFGTKKSLQVTLKKVACDQCIFAPSFLCIFLTSVGILHGNNLQDIKKKFHNEYWDILLTNWAIWPAVQTFNFYFLPLKYQVLLAQTVAVVWNSYLSWKTEKN